MDHPYGEVKDREKPCLRGLTFRLYFFFSGSGIRVAASKAKR